MKVDAIHAGGGLPGQPGGVVVLDIPVADVKQVQDAGLEAQARELVAHLGIHQRGRIGPDAVVLGEGVLPEVPQADRGERAAPDRTPAEARRDDPLQRPGDADLPRVDESRPPEGDVEVEGQLGTGTVEGAEDDPPLALIELVTLDRVTQEVAEVREQAEIGVDGEGLDLLRRGSAQAAPRP